MPVEHHTDLESSPNLPVRVVGVFQAELFPPGSQGENKDHSREKKGPAQPPPCSLKHIQNKTAILSPSLGIAMETHSLNKLQEKKNDRQTTTASCISSTRRPCKGQPRPGHKFSGTGALYQGKGMSFHLCISPQALT